MLNDYPDSFTLMQIHLGDGYQTTFGNNRATAYGVTGTPDAWFDGDINRGGAYQNVTQQYNYYMSAYNTRQATSTDVTIEMYGEVVSGHTYEITSVVCIEPGGTAKTVRVRTAQVLDYWPCTYCRNGFKKASGVEDIALEPGECAWVTSTFDYDETDSWDNREDIRQITWVWDPNEAVPAEVHNAQWIGWEFPLPPAIGDLNCDSYIDNFDIDPFVLALTSSAHPDPFDDYYDAFPACNGMLADTNGDGTVNNFDIDPFVDLLTK